MLLVSESTWFFPPSRASAKWPRPETQKSRLKRSFSLAASRSRRSAVSPSF
jgi:hypothetical protein